MVLFSQQNMALCDTVLCWWTLGLILLATCPGVLCDDNSIAGPLLVSVIVAVFYLLVVIVMLILGITWNTWYARLQWGRGRVKMPEEYWRKKRMEGTRHLLMARHIVTKESNSSSNNRNIVNKLRRDVLPPVVAAQPVVLSNGHSTSMANADEPRMRGGRSLAAPVADESYEEMSVSMNLQAEGGHPSEEICIETTVSIDSENDFDPSSYADIDPNNASDLQLSLEQDNDPKTTPDLHPSQINDIDPDITPDLQLSPVKNTDANNTSSLHPLSDHDTDPKMTPDLHLSPV